MDFGNGTIKTIIMDRTIPRVIKVSNTLRTPTVQSQGEVPISGTISNQPKKNEPNNTDVSFLVDVVGMHGAKDTYDGWEYQFFDAKLRRGAATGMDFVLTLVESAEVASPLWNNDINSVSAQSSRC